MNAFCLLFLILRDPDGELAPTERELILKVPRRKDSTTPKCASPQSMCRNGRLVPTAGLWHPLVVKVQRCTVKPRH